MGTGQVDQSRPWMAVGQEITDILQHIDPASFFAVAGVFADATQWPLPIGLPLTGTFQAAPANRSWSFRSIPQIDTADVTHEGYFYSEEINAKLTTAKLSPKDGRRLP